MSSMHQRKTFGDHLTTLRRGWWLLALFMILFAGAGYALSMYVIPKTYEATAYILVVPQANAEATSTPTLVSTYQDILRSPEVVDQVAQKMNVTDKRLFDLTDRLTVSSNLDSQVIALSVTDRSAEQAAIQANTMTEVFQDYLPQLINTSKTEVFSSARIPTNPVSPNILMNTGIGGVLGLMLGLLIVYSRSLSKKEATRESTDSYPKAIPRTHS
ncbi:lipopolysaccharide biosynthesis protein [Exiguobacterium sp. Leaf187]|uniref:Lipopolysaccharide biosynthesis protein n=2 Tax=Exiguobacterium indicum TaxID=296995 RepID=A0A0V8GI79_9BACL|nr:lipopolysaccharide biosynthesis protein [Exiguobacterium sp. MH3]KQS20010.1 lipopolysaccharide biosynthesis protein [Exiguobacterium sp. Leaf187]KSU49987.1 lipopolysaccharide biosynthesis protein [Exiguobacterium enclense]SDB87526.1 Capsular polysaccharide biosynthesis protein [Exiguobacterium enclense]